MSSNVFGLLFAGILIFTNTVKAGSLPENYQSLDASTKQGLLWNYVSEKPYSLPPDLFLSIFTSMIKEGIKHPLSIPISPKNLNRTLVHDGDLMPEGKPGKFIHKFGVVVKAHFKSEQTNAALGILGEAGNVPAILRLSLAGPFNYLAANLPLNSEHFVPGIALKLFVNNHSSLNIMAMEQLEGQGHDVDFFKHTFSSSIPAPKNPAEFYKTRLETSLSLPELKIGKFKFPNVLPKEVKFNIETHFDLIPPHKFGDYFMYRFLKFAETEFKAAVNGPANILPVNHFTQMDQKGRLVENSTKLLKLEFEPTAAVKTAFQNSFLWKLDFRQAILEIEPETELYKVWATNTENKRFSIGKIVSEDFAVMSKEADEDTFFQHHIPGIKKL